jgi:hypothetical protein
MNSLLALLLFLCGDLPATAPVDEGDMERIVETWQSQGSAVAAVRIDFRILRATEFEGLEHFSVEAFESAIAPSLGKELTAETKEAVVESLFGRKLSELPQGRFLYDGERIREEIQTEFGARVQVLDNGYKVSMDPANHQVMIRDLQDSHEYLMDLKSFRYLPGPSLFERLRASKAGRSRNRLVFSGHVENGDFCECEIDTATGNVSLLSCFRGRSRTPRLTILQSDFRTLPGDVQMPFWRLDVTYYTDGTPGLIEFLAVESADVNVDIPKGEFAVSAPVGTVVFDYRGRGTRPPRCRPR